MTRFVIDAPVLVRIVTEEVEIADGHSLVAPNVLRSQALGLLYAAVQAGELDEKSALRLHERMTELKIRLLGDRVSRGTAWRLARDNGWETLDAAEYLAVAKLQADALITDDPVLRDLGAGIVEVAGIEALTRS
ncbi:hypothetical protein GIS00_04885 [Nakamurella sp. YIM 132087]|uniref:Type II toxin-antitoxin system VapC family toxin n=1 Tax=Nakamurella alba TaxID=2665158 RepID=A0A7K1FJ42_9ACTN|nr:hypothetical protein [Nakamurella alba]MTD13283.1 hypothetical protein [Nakamurella alba]